MTRDGLPRAYLRIDPNIDQHPDALSMVRALCAAARQPNRGRFRDPTVLERAVGRRQYRAMVERGDVIADQPGPGVYLDGWDEWQEGDLTVGERMRRMRLRRKGKAVSTVTEPSSLRRNDVTTDAVAKGEGLGGEGVRVGVSPPPQAGKRANGTNPRALGTNPRAAGTSLRQKREAEKRGPTRLHEILSAIQKGPADADA